MREKCAESMIGILPYIFKKFKKVYQVTDMQRQQLELLFKIGKFDGKPTSFYSDMMMIPRSNVTVASNKLVEDGLIERVPSEEDRRVIILKVTDKGRTYLDKYLNEVKLAMMDKLSKYEDDDIKRIDEILDELRTIMDKVND